mmetsp:Transcript_44339/g.126967  ORF Transcript_44339/g.126967 Transcript_44339/m.126967 type:complete len:226 (-) Transcript_44339:343-1020(-)
MGRGHRGRKEKSGGEVAPIQIALTEETEEATGPPGGGQHLRGDSLPQRFSGQALQQVVHCLQPGQNGGGIRLSHCVCHLRVIGAHEDPGILQQPEDKTVIQVGARWVASSASHAIRQQHLLKGARVMLFQTDQHCRGHAGLRSGAEEGAWIAREGALEVPQLVEGRRFRLHNLRPELKPKLAAGKAGGELLHGLASVLAIHDQEVVRLIRGHDDEVDLPELQVPT